MNFSGVKKQNQDIDFARKNELMQCDKCATCVACGQHVKGYRIIEAIDET